MPPKPLQPAILISTKRKRASHGDDSQVESQDLELTQSWREILGPPPPTGKTRVGKQRFQYIKLETFSCNSKCTCSAFESKTFQR